MKTAENVNRYFLSTLNQKPLKKVLLLLLILMTMLSCIKNEEESILIYPDFILAGVYGYELKGILYTEIGTAPRILSDNYADLPIYEELIIDMNDDGIDDYKIVRSRSFTSEYDSLQTKIIPLNDNELVAPEHNANLADALMPLDTIDANSNWVNNTCTIFDKYQTQTDTVSVGVWESFAPRSIGTRTQFEDKYLYGWIRMHISSEAWGNSLVIYGYATTRGYN